VNWTVWNLAPLVLAGAAVALARFVDAFLRLRRRGRTDHASWPKAGLFLLGVALGTLPLISPLDEAGDTYLLSAHMLQHVLIADVAPALALVALRGPLLFFFLPSPVLRRIAHSSRIRSVLAVLLRPRVSLAIWALVVGAWHIPVVYDYALTHQTTHDLEHLSFVVVGLLAWTQIVDPARRNTLTRQQRLGCAFAMAAFSVGLGGVLVAAGPLYPAYASQTIRLFGLSPAGDQHLAALVMLTEQLAAFALCAAWLLPDLGRARIARRQRLSADRPADALR
jgi:putative membrane protein